MKTAVTVVNQKSARDVPIIVQEEKLKATAGNSSLMRNWNLTMTGNLENADVPSEMPENFLVATRWVD